MRKLLLLPILLVAASLHAQDACPQGPDPFGLGRPAEWTIQYNAYFGDGSDAILWRHVCRDWMPVINGSPVDTVADLMWWSYEFENCSGDPCDAAIWPSQVQWWLPPDLEVSYVRRRP